VLSVGIAEFAFAGKKKQDMVLLEKALVDGVQNVGSSYAA